MGTTKTFSDNGTGHGAYNPIPLVTWKYSQTPAQNRLKQNSYIAIRESPRDA